jgi:hypothetical protein
MFVVASAHDLPAELAGRADAVRVHFPWGSLLEAVLAGDERVARGVAGLMASDAELVILVSVVARDRIAGLTDLDDRSSRHVGARFAAAAGLRFDGSRLVTDDDLAESHSTWAKRLGVGHNRPAWRLRLNR